MKPWLLEHLKCPACEEGSPLALRASEFRNGEVFAGSLACNAGHAFAIDGYIADFVARGDVVSERSQVYDVLWDAHVRQSYDGRIDEYRGKFQAFAKLPGPIEVYLAGKRVLDAGCGEGRFSYLASALGAQHVVGVDYSLEALRRAVGGTGNPPNCSFIRADVLNLPLSKTFDYVFSLGVLHHTPRTRQAYHAIVRHLKVGGYITIFVYGRWKLPLIIWPLRLLSLGINPERIRRVCDALGLGYDRSVPPRIPLGPLFRRLGRLDLLGVGRITYEGLTTPYLWEHSLREVKSWFAEAGVELISSSKMVSASGSLVEAGGSEAR